MCHHQPVHKLTYVNSPVFCLPPYSEGRSVSLLLLSRSVQVGSDPYPLLLQDSITVILTLCESPLNCSHRFIKLKKFSLIQHLPPNYCLFLWSVFSSLLRKVSKLAFSTSPPHIHSLVFSNLASVYHFTNPNSMIKTSRPTSIFRLLTSSAVSWELTLLPGTTLYTRLAHAMVL